MSDVGDVVIVCGLGHLRKRRRSNPKIPLVVFAAEFDRKGPKKEGREDLGGRDDRGRDMPPWHAKRRFVPPPSSSAAQLACLWDPSSPFSLVGQVGLEG